MGYENGLISGVITSLTVIIITYVIIKTHRIEDIIVMSATEFVAETSQNIELQKNIYALGALLGNGAKTGIGLNKKSGKMGMTDLLMGIAGQYLGLNKSEEGLNNSSSQLP